MNRKFLIDIVKRASDLTNKELAEKFINEINSQGIYLDGYNHFDAYHRIYKVPELIELIDKII